MKILPGKWVFDVKTDADNYILTYTELDGLSAEIDNAKDWILITPTHQL